MSGAGEVTSTGGLAQATNGEAFELFYDVTRSDWIAANTEDYDTHSDWIAHFRSKKSKRTERMVAIALLIIVLVWIVAAKTSKLDESEHKAFVFGGILFILIMALYGQATGDKAAKAKQIKELHAMDFSRFSGRTRAYCSYAWVLFERDGASHRLAWKHVQLRSGTQYITFITQDSGLFLFSRTAIGSAPEQEHRIKLISDWIAESQLPESKRLALWLKERPTPCPKCRYQLANLQGDKCPECGHVLTVDELNARATRWA